MELTDLLDEQASVGAEYALLLSLVLLALVAAITNLGNVIRDLVAAANPFF